MRVYFLNTILLKAETHEPILAADTDGGNWGTENCGTVSIARVEKCMTRKCRTKMPGWKVRH